MIGVYPTLYRITASSCGSLSVIPLDLLQTQIISKRKPTITLNELKFIFYNIIIFTAQNTAYSLSEKINNQSIRGLLAGFAATPVFYIMEIRKMLSRLNMYPNSTDLLIWLSIREIVVYTLLYNIIILDIPYSKFIGPLLSNACGFPFKIIALKKGYPTLHVSYSSIKKTAVIEILKNSINDAITLYLIYNGPYSPFAS